MEKYGDHYYVEKVRMGEIACFSFLLEKYSRTVFSLIVKITGNREEAEELTQDVFLKVFRSLSGFRENSSFSTWLYRVAYNTAISATRKKRPPVVSIEERVLPGPTEEAEASGTEEALRRLETALLMLSPDERGLIMLFYIQERSVEELVQISGLTASNVKTKLFRIRKKLLVIIKEMEEK